ncbi:MAG: NADH-quinone oxidoreductase subunit H [Anaerolineae bacterium]|nr:NADH-quinone oxidoreductase subunit H [Anaerolineae bacterium]
MTGLFENIVSHGWAVFLAKLIGAFVVGTAGLLWTLIGIWFERKVAGRFQDRLGPNRVGLGPKGRFNLSYKFGWAQSIADLIKIFLKEDIRNTGTDRWTFNLAPIMVTMSVVLLWAVIPFSDGWIGTDLNVGVAYLIAVGGIGTIGVMMAGWGSNNKYSLLAGFRSVAQLISYEIPMVVALLVPVLMAGSMSTQTIIRQQYIAFMFAVPMTLLIFLISGQAENGRGPFDLLEGESEIVAGFHVEYSGMKFGMFMVSEFLHAFTLGLLTAILFMGGWRIPFVPLDWVQEGKYLGSFIWNLLGFVMLLSKAMIAYFVLIWVRMTLPRLRIDHLLNFNWKFLVPLSLINLLVVAFVWKAIPGTDAINSFADAFIPSVVLLIVNMAMFLGVGAVLADKGRQERARVAARVYPETVEAAPTN